MNTHRSGRPRITTVSEDRALKFRSLKDRKLTALDLRRTVITKYNRYATGLNERVAAKKPLLCLDQRLRSLRWAQIGQLMIGERLFLVIRAPLL